MPVSERNRAQGQTAFELDDPRLPGGIVTDFWQQVGKFDPRTAELADRHYNRRKVGSPQFMPPGQTLILLSHDEKAVFGWWRPHPDSGIPSINGLDGWTCTIFRNESPVLSSAMILDAEGALYATGHDIGPDGLLTYVWDSRIRSVNPGYCFKRAGWTVRGRSADGRKTLLWKDRPKVAGTRFHSRAGSDRAGWPSAASIRVRESQRPGSRRLIGLAAWAYSEDTHHAR